MADFTFAKTADGACFFTEATRRIYKKSKESYRGQQFFKAFTLDAVPKKAVLLALTENHSELILNGNARISLDVRSYLFDRAYEAYDVTPYLVQGENTVSVYHIDKGEGDLYGFAMEIQGNGKTLLRTDESFLCRDDPACISAINANIIGGGEETVMGENAMDAPYITDDSWENAVSVGILSGNQTAVHQSIIREQTAIPCYPTALTGILTGKEPKGIRIRLTPMGNGMTVAATTVCCDKNCTCTLTSFGGLLGFAVDGEKSTFDKPFSLTKGEHFLLFTYVWQSNFFIETDGKLALISPTGNEKPFASYLLPLMPIRYPWNEYRDSEEREKTGAPFYSVKTYAALRSKMGQDGQPMDFSAYDGTYWNLQTRRFAVLTSKPHDTGLLLTKNIVTTDEPCSMTGEHTVFSENAMMTVPPKDGYTSFILDFGTERIGRIYFDLTAPKGTKIEMAAFEMITDRGIAYMNEANTLLYRCKDGRQRYFSHRKRGFRYLQICVSGQKSHVTFHDIHVVETRYPTEKGDFSCSDERLNRIYEMSVRTAETCMTDLYCDCPGYEQNTWTGDAAVTAEVNLYNFGAFAFEKQYLRLIGQSIDRGVAAVYRRGNPRYDSDLYLPCACFPTYPEGCIPIWSLQFLMQGIKSYTVTGDRKLLESHFAVMEESINRFVKMTDDRGLFDMQGAWNLIEWANNDLDFYGEVTANNIYLSYFIKEAAKIAAILGKAELAMRYTTLADAYKNAVNAYCYDENKKAYVDTVRDRYSYDRYIAYMQERKMPIASFETYVQKSRISVQTNTFAVLFDCADGERKENAIRFLLDNMESGHYVPGTPANRSAKAPTEAEAPNGYVHIGSPFFLYFALQTLYKEEYSDLALQVIRRDFGKLLDLGLKTCTETFIHENGWTRSAAHAWSASPAIFMMTEILGIKPIEEGYTAFTVEPKCGNLTHAKGSVPTPYGRIHVEWKKEKDGTLHIDCKAPAACKQVKK